MKREPIRVLLIEDDAADATLVRLALGKSTLTPFALTSVDSVAAAINIGKTAHFDAVVTDLHLTDSQGVTTVKTLVDLFAGTPLVVLTHSDDEEEEAAALRAGAQDYLVKKEVGGMLLPRTILHTIERQRLSEALLRANRDLQAANRELESFAHSVSHDLRAPLRAIDGFTHILAEDLGGALSPEALEHMRRIQAAVQKMNEMIGALRTLSRLGSGEPERKRFSMEHLARECLEELAPDTYGREVRIDFGFLPEAYANRAMLRHAVLNLLSNALKYSRGRQPAHVEVDSENLGGEIVYRVRDNGVGFDMKLADRLFTAFQRLHSGDEFEGTGMGLAIAQRAVLRHGGRIWAESAPGQGATFRFTLGVKSAR